MVLLQARVLLLGMEVDKTQGGRPLEVAVQRAGWGFEATVTNDDHERMDSVSCADVLVGRKYVLLRLAY
jgi:hypothetical protein